MKKFGGRGLLATVLNLSLFLCVFILIDYADLPMKILNNQLNYIQFIITTLVII